MKKKQVVNQKWQLGQILDLQNKQVEVVEVISDTKVHVKNTEEPFDSFVVQFSKPENNFVNKEMEEE